MKSASWSRLLALFTIVTLIEAAFYGQLSAFIPLHLPELGIPADGVKAWTGAIASFASVVGIPLVPIWGALADRYSRKLIIVRTFVIHTLAAAVMVLAPNVWVFTVGRALMGIANGDTALMLATMGERAPAQRLGFAFAVINGCLSVGAFSGSLLGGPIFDRYGFNTLLTITGSLLFGVLIALIVGFREQPRPRVVRPILATSLESVRLISGSPILRLLFLAQMVMGIAWVSVNTFLPLHIAEMHTGPDMGTVVGIVMAAGGAGTLILSPLFGSLADRIGYWRTLFAGIAVIIGLWIAVFFADTLPPFMGLWALLNGVASAISSISFNVLSESAPTDARGRIMVFAYVPLNFGSFIGPLVGGAVTTFGLIAVYPAAAGLSLAAMGLFWLARRTKRNSLGSA